MVKPAQLSAALLLPKARQLICLVHEAQALPGAPLRLDKAIHDKAGYHEYIHRKAQALVLGLGTNVLEPITITEAATAPRIVYPKSAYADQQRAMDVNARPRNALQPEDKWSGVWCKREERVASSLRRHVIITRASAGGDSKAAIAARRKLQSRLR